MPEPQVLGKNGGLTAAKLKKEFALDGHHVFKAGKAHNVCGNTWRMLQQTRFKDHFTFVGGT
jgi:arsenite methyltransferase